LLILGIDRGINLAHFALCLGQGFVFFDLLFHAFQHRNSAGGVDLGQMLIDLLRRFSGLGTRS